jgi:hypothetical protein
MEFPLTEVSNGTMNKLKEFDLPLFQMPMKIERAKIGRLSGNHGTVTKPVSAASSGNFIEDSKEETEILAEARVLRNGLMERLGSRISFFLHCFGLLSY